MINGYSFLRFFCHTHTHTLTLMSLILNISSLSWGSLIRTRSATVFCKCVYWKNFSFPPQKKKKKDLARELIFVKAMTIAKQNVVLLI